MRNDEEVKMQLKEETMEIVKENVQTAQVAMYREFVVEEKTITVPVTREDLVIKKKLLDPCLPEDEQSPVETIRIPIWEERVEVSRNPVELNEVEITHRVYQENERIHENLKNENIYIHISGDVRVKENTIL